MVWSVDVLGLIRSIFWRLLDNRPCARNVFVDDHFGLSVGPATLLKSFERLSENQNVV